MEAKNKKGAIAVVVVLAIAATVFFIVKKNNKSLTKTEKVRAIMNNPYSNTHNFDVFMTFEDGYVNAWYEALVKNNQKTFTYNGKNYRTQGGTLVK